MKKINYSILSLFVILILTESNDVLAQEIGLRIENKNIGADAMFPFEKGMLHTDLLLHNSLFIFDGFSADALYDFIYRPIGNTEFHWYVGAGFSGFFNSSKARLGASGEAGIEYRFESIPIVLGIDGRPTVWVIGSNSLDFERFGFNARWVF